ncbi:uncharacterized protein LY89DRAFT_782257 [Mollisia scopiformis]|uniref:Zn(2)-C6 fungal-type domain-containing protein n=1 Tax=Mollisia scopiformis TaxID=149040 RepID=A0A194XA52_MOLSC|nr:uncharacterized protein LY89DRAFT_782257 [Mollisia scopiformis]KUJ17045.1 hypothetical protein LY89DRAFT_782257 [Mollisia scopiformis]
MMVHSTVEKKKRIGAPKSRRGCQTCKVRHKKCDEQKPACTPCVQTGRTCDFLHPTSTPLSIQKSKGPLKPVPRSRMIQLPKLIPTPTFGSPFLSHELPHFEHFFHLLTFSSLPHHSNTFLRLILQISHEETCIRQAVIAISVLLKYQSRHHHPSVNVKAYLVEGYLIYAKALEGVNRRVAEGNVEIALLGSILFAMFEVLAGREAVGQHLLGDGGNVLRERLRNTKPSDTLLDIHQAFCCLDIQACTWDTFYGSFEVPDPIIPSTFHSLQSARLTLDSITYRMWHLLRPIKPHEQTLPYSPLPSLLAAKIYHINNLLSIWQERFAQMEFKPEDIAGHNILKLQYLAATITLSTMFYRDQLAYDAFLPSFRSIVDLASCVLFPPSCKQKVPQGKTAPTFAFETALIPSLYLTALKCREKILRRRAIELLGYCGTEGVWIGAAMAAVSMWIMGLEEADQAEGGFVREEMRCKEVRVNIDRRKWRLLVMTRRRGRDGEMEYLPCGLSWGDEEVVVQGKEKEEEDWELLNKIADWRASFRTLDVVLRIPGRERRGRR